VSEENWMPAFAGMTVPGNAEHNFKRKAPGDTEQRIKTRTNIPDSSGAGRRGISAR
jgi:hypothetical protein